jgi:aspartyl protease family protein
MTARNSAAALLCVLAGAVPAQAADVVAEALLPGMAVLQIDGERVTLRQGQSHGTVRVIAVTRETAVLEIGGQRRELGLSGRVDTSFSEPERRSITLQRNGQMQYITSAEINGRRVEVLVDTGANTVAMNSAQAAALGIAADEGVAASVQTASDVLPARQVTLRSVSVGGIQVQNISATVIDGENPTTVLLGMTYLRHVELTERDGVLTMSAKW